MMSNTNPLLPIALLVIIIMWFSNKVEGYKNYTVGDSMGWYDSGVKPGVDYQKWASSIESFSLGDFLIFNTDNNRSVSQTYSITTYKSCSDTNDKDVTLWSTSTPSSTSVYPVKVVVPLLKEGTTYFFSADYDGDECKAGQKFQIEVTHGKGLPPDLAIEYNLHSAADAEAPGPAGEADSGDDNNNGDESGKHSPISADFNHPKNDTSSGGADDGGGDDGTVKKSGVARSGVPEMGVLVAITLVLLVQSLYGLQIV